MYIQWKYKVDIIYSISDAVVALVGLSNDMICKIRKIWHEFIFLIYYFFKSDLIKIETNVFLLGVNYYK